jgi:hypothetical protein
VAVERQDFDAPDRTTVDEARRLASEADIVVAIVAHRYGWVPTKDDGGDDRRSLAWIEVEAAVQSGKTVLAFVIDDAQPWPFLKERDIASRDVDVPAHASVAHPTELERFTEYLKKNHRCERFGDPSDLAGKVTAAVKQEITRLKRAEKEAHEQAAKQAALAPAAVRASVPVAATARVFISYRREDSINMAGRIRDRLARDLGEENVFFDLDSIAFGSDFRVAISSTLAEVDAVLVIIGRQWLGSFASHTGQDFVRTEVELALKGHAPVIPVLIDDTVMPDEAQLPASIIELAYRNAAPVRHDPDFHPDMDRLVRSLTARAPRR